MGIPSPCNRKSIPGPTDQSGEASEISSDIGARVRSSVAEERSPPRSQKAGLAAEHKWTPVQNLPFPEVVLYAYAADRIRPFPHTYACPQDCTRRVQDRLWHRPALNRKSYPCQVCTSLMDGGYIQHYQSPATYHAPKKRQFRDRSCYTVRCGTNPVARRRSLATAAKNQAEDGPNTRRAAVRACKYLRAHTQPI